MAQLTWKDCKTIKELLEVVTEFDSGIYYNDKLYPNITNTIFRGTIKGTSEGHIAWVSTNKQFLMDTNKDILEFKGDIMPYSETDDNVFVLFVNLNQIGLKY